MPVSRVRVTEHTRRAPRLLRDGSHEPGPKPTIAPDWIAATGTDTVDIANMEHRDLPKDWQ
ncbi:hypothetical protein [Nocardia sp. NBC_00403]|uniref:hypothetical protein n=1 Tax=Nocardia sp. NBC_00403 TaxID=2975990 RepID=UPI002E1B207A